MANEIRLIDANALKFHYAKMMYPDGTNSNGYHAFVTSVEVKDAPTVDAVEVVRCRECKYSYGNKYCTNDAWKDEGNTVYIEPDAFCSYGERRGKDG